MTVTVITATRHHHGRELIEQWFGDRVRFHSLSPSRREAMTRDYLNRVVAEIHEGVQKLEITGPVFFLLTGHPFLNSVAMFALRRKINDPFLILVFDGIADYHAWNSNFVIEYPTLQHWTQQAVGSQERPEPIT